MIDRVVGALRALNSHSVGYASIATVVGPLLVEIAQPGAIAHTLDALHIPAPHWLPFAVSAIGGVGAWLSRPPTIPAAGKVTATVSFDFSPVLKAAKPLLESALAIAKSDEPAALTALAGLNVKLGDELEAEGVALLENLKAPGLAGVGLGLLKPQIPAAAKALESQLIAQARSAEKALLDAALARAEAVVAAL